MEVMKCYRQLKNEKAVPLVMNNVVLEIINDYEIDNDSAVNLRPWIIEPYKGSMQRRRPKPDEVGELVIDNGNMIKTCKSRLDDLIEVEFITTQY